MKTLIICHECDLPQGLKSLPNGAMARCSRCGAKLRQAKRCGIERALALTIAGLVLFTLANAFPFLAFKMDAQVQQTTLWTGIKELYFQEMAWLAAAVLVTTVVAPFLQLMGLLYVLLPLKLGRLPWKPATVFRGLGFLKPWGMMEVFMLGILVSVVKLGEMGTIVPGIALYSFFALIFVLAASQAVLDPVAVWECLDSRGKRAV
jgi:paraquat-inducible protein A